MYKKYVLYVVFKRPWDKANMNIREPYLIKKESPENKNSLFQPKLLQYMKGFVSCIHTFSGLSQDY